MRHQPAAQGVARGSTGAGCKGIVRLCRSMENCIGGIGRKTGTARLKAAVSTLAEACQVIAMHAKIASGISRIGDARETDGAAERALPVD